MFLRKILPVLIVGLLQGNFAIAMDPQQIDLQEPIKVEFDLLPGHTRPITALATLSVGQNSKYIISGSENGVIRIWDFNTKECLHELRGHESTITSLDIIQQDLNNFIVSGSLDGTVGLWNLERGQFVVGLDHDQPVVSIAAIGDNYAASLSEDGKIVIWDFIQGCEIRQFDHDGNTPVKFLSYNGQKGSPIFTASEKSVKMWDAAKDGCQRTIPIAGEITGMMSFFLQPYILVAKTSDNPVADSYSVLFYVINPGKEIFHYDNHDVTQDITTCDNGTGWQITLACTNKGIFRLYDSKQKGTIVWSGVDANNNFVPTKAACLDGHLIYASKDTCNLMVSCDPVLPRVDKQDSIQTSGIFV